MKVVVCLDGNNKIQWVKSFDWYKEHKKWSEEKIVEAVAKSNNDDKCQSFFAIWEANGTIGNLVEFLLGDKKYKIYADIDVLDDSINELSCYLDSMHDDIFHMSQSMENIENMFKEFKEKLTKKGYYSV
jgi:hypothetical protein